MNLRSKVVRLLESGNHPVIYIITVKTYYAILMSMFTKFHGKDCCVHCKQQCIPRIFLVIDEHKATSPWSLRSSYIFPQHTLHSPTPNCLVTGHSYVIELQIDTKMLCQQNGWHCADKIFNALFLYDKFCILIEIILYYIPMGSIDNNKLKLV